MHRLLRLPDGMYGPAGHSSPAGTDIFVPHRSLGTNRPAVLPVCPLRPVRKMQRGLSHGVSLPGFPWIDSSGYNSLHSMQSLPRGLSYERHLLRSRHRYRRQMRWMHRPYRGRQATCLCPYLSHRRLDTGDRLKESLYFARSRGIPYCRS